MDERTQALMDELVAFLVNTSSAESSLRIITKRLPIMHPLLNIAITAVRQAATIIMRASDRIDTVKISSKGHHDFVTEIDQLAEAAIIEVIRKSHPEHGILAEESGLSPGDNHTWIIDPLDGTTNFIHGLPHFAISIGIKIENKLMHGVIYDPVRQELFTASRGEGAQVNGRKLRVNQPRDLHGALIGLGFPFRDPSMLKQHMQYIQAFTPYIGGYRRSGSAALDLAYVAAGRLDGYWELNLKSWDIAAGALIVREAGGLIGDLNGDEHYLESGDVVAASPKVFAAMIKLLQANRQD